MNKLDPGTRLLVGSHKTEVVKYLAEGGFAHIYVVRYTPTEDGNELGVLKRVIVRSKSDLTLLRREVDTMQKLSQSKYVVRLFDSNAQKLPDGTYEVLLLMEYCPNKSLLDYMNQHLKTKLNIDQITKIMFQICLAIHSMHSIKLIHRDLKIENVLIDSEGNFKLADFGSSCDFIKAPTNQEEFQIIANDIIHNTTPQYRAPEMIDLYKNVPIDEKSDIWALGVFLYKLMYYTTPFEHQGELSILHGFYQFPPQPKYPSKLINLVIIMLQVNVRIRPNIYQVLCEICKIRNVPVPVEDIYSHGPYDFDAYATYQQYIQEKNQEEADAISEHMKIKKKIYVENQLKQKQPANLNKTNSMSGTSNSIDVTHELEHASLPNIDLGINNNTVVSNEEDEEPIDIEQRFPEVEDLDNLTSIDKKFPKVDELEPKVVDTKINDISAISSSQSQSISSNAKSEPLSNTTTTENLGLKLTHTEAWTDIPNSKDVDVNGVFTSQKSSVSTENGKKLTDTPSSITATTTETVQPLPEFASRPKVTKKNSFFALFDDIESEFHAQPEQQSPDGLLLQQQKLYQQQQRQTSVDDSLMASRNPFSSNQQTPHSEQVTGSNPWAQYSASSTSANTYQQNVPRNQHPLIVNNHINYEKLNDGVNQVPYQLSNPNESQQQFFNYVPSQSQQRAQTNVLYPTNNTPHSIHMPTDKPQTSSSVKSTGNLINPEDLQFKPSSKRPQLDLNLLDLDVSSRSMNSSISTPMSTGPSQIATRKKKSDVNVTSIERNITDNQSLVDTTTDSENLDSGDLKVQEIEISSSRKPSTGNNVPPSVPARRPLEKPSSRKSIELNLDLQELNLNEKKTERSVSITFNDEDKLENSNDIHEDDEGDEDEEYEDGNDENSSSNVRRHSRSLSLRRSNSKLRSKSKLRKSIEETAAKRKSFLGF